MSVLFVGTAALLLIPEWREGHARAGWIGAVRLPLWVPSAFLMITSAICAALIIKHQRRR